MNATLSRRTFIGSCLVALPTARLLAANLPLCEAEFTLDFHRKLPPVVIKTYSNGNISALWGGKPCNVRKDGDWKRITAQNNGSSVELRVRRTKACALDMDWFAAAAMDDPNETGFRSVVCAPGEVFLPLTRTA